MTSELRHLQQTVRFDREATISLYEDTIKVPGADECRCIYCKNFAAQRGQVYPEEFLKLLDSLGADARKELEAFDYDFGPENPPNHLYGGWFVFCGELISGDEKQPELEFGETAFAYWFTSSFPNGGLPKDAKVCAVKFNVLIPWVLSASPE